MSNEATKCPYCSKIFFISDSNICPFCHKDVSQRDPMNIFNQIFDGFTNNENKEN